jgi:hypothetical protein
MAKRFCVVLGAFLVAGTVWAALAPAVSKVNTILTISYQGSIEGGGVFSGKVKSPGNRYCANKRLVTLFHDGVRVFTPEKTEKTGSWAIGSFAIGSGAYEARVAQKQLPASLQKKPGKKNRIICKAATSATVTVP